jgi:hypothetical protein
MQNRTCLELLVPHLLTRPYSSGSDCIPASPMIMTARKLEASVMDPLTLVKQWSMARLMHPHHNRLISDFKSLCQHCWVCTSDTPMPPMHSLKQIVPSRSIICAAIKSSAIGGQNSTLTFPFLLMWWLLSSRTFRVILNAHTSG